MIEWENGEVTSEPLSIVAADDPVTCAIYARENDLLDLDGWKWFKGIAKRNKKSLRMVTQAQLRSYRTALRYKYSYEVPRDYNNAVEPNKRNGNTKWQESTALEMSQLHEYKTFKDLGKAEKPPEGYWKICAHLVFDVKHDGRHRSRLVADRRLTQVLLDSIYSGVVSLRGTRLLAFLAKLNDLDIWATGITMCMSPRKYIKKLLGAYERIFGSKPKQNDASPLKKEDHPELDMSEGLDANGIKDYQLLIGGLQWSVSLGRIDITIAIMTMSGFRVAPRQGHLECMQRIISYLVKTKHAAICFRTEEPDFSALPDQQFDWMYTVYGQMEEVLPHDMPTPLGKFVTLTHYVDANLYHDLITGRSVTGILHLANKTPIDWYSKKQATVETATYGSEFIAARICVDQSIDLKNTLCYLGVPVRKKAYMFGDNKSVVDSSTIPHAKLHKRHNALSFHRVREAIAGAIIGFYHIDGTENPADIFSKHWGYRQIWKLLQPLLFWIGDT